MNYCVIQPDLGQYHACTRVAKQIITIEEQLALEAYCCCSKFTDFVEPTQQQAQDVESSYGRQCDTMTSHWRYYDVVLRLCACWVNKQQQLYVFPYCFQKAATLRGGDQPSPAPCPMACHRVERLTGNFMPAAMLMRTASLQRLRYPLGGCWS